MISIKIVMGLLFGASIISLAQAESQSKIDEQDWETLDDYIIDDAYELCNACLWHNETEFGEGAELRSVFLDVSPFCLWEWEGEAYNIAEEIEK